MPQLIWELAQMGTSRWIFTVLLMAVIAGCSPGPKAEAEAQQRQNPKGPAAVDVAITKTASLQNNLEYVGTTQPYRQVSLRAQVEGQVLRLLADVGDSVKQGQVLAKLDDKVLATAVIEAQAEVTALESEVAQARAQVSDALRQAESARLALRQAQADSARYDKLYKVGALTQQQTEQARTAAGTAQQALRSAEEVVRTRRQTVGAAQRRVRAKQAAVAREQERRSYSNLTSPISGIVLERVSEPGNLAQAGSEILKLGDFSQVKVAVQISELELKTIRVGQTVQVKLDAFGNETFRGQITRLSPVADPTARLLPIEIAIPNVGRRIGSGLLARVSFGQQTTSSVVVSETALQTHQNRRGRNQEARQEDDAKSQRASKTGILFVVNGLGKGVTVTARNVALGQRRDGQVEVVTGLRPGDRLVTRSSKALKNGDPVRLSILSEPSTPELTKRKSAKP